MLWLGTIIDPKFIYFKIHFWFVYLIGQIRITSWKPPNAKRHRQRWIDRIIEDLKMLEVWNEEEKEKDREKWRQIVVGVPNGPKRPVESLRRRRRRYLSDTWSLKGKVTTLHTSSESFSGISIGLTILRRSRVKCANEITYLTKIIYYNKIIVQWTKIPLKKKK